MTEKPRVLFVDDNENLLNAIKRVMRKQVDLQTADSGGEALKILEAGPEFAVLVSDQNMPNMKGAELLAEAAARWPNTVRVMLTGNDDQVTAAAAVNDGKVFRFMRKPCDPDKLLEVIEAAAAHHQTITAEKRLLEQTLAGSIKVLSDVLATLRPDLFKHASKVRRGARVVAAKMQLENAWELDLAAMLYPLGLVSVPDAVIEKYIRSERLLPVEQQMINQGTEVAAKLIKNIPRLENVAHGIAMYRKGFDGSGYPVGEKGGASLPLISRILRILVDLVDAASVEHASLEHAANALRNRASIYDPELLDKVIEIIGVSPTLKKPEKDSEIHVKSHLLRPGDITVGNVLGKDGKLLLVAGSELSEVTIQRIRNFENNGEIAEDILILRHTETA